ncbi:MAG: GAF domain-containing protein [Spirochaetota bacterium]
MSDDDSLRKKAERRISERRAGESADRHSEEAKTNDYELRVHQVELEMQNEELRRTQRELKESQVRYFDLFDQAPVAYLTLDEKGLIGSCNLMAASLLGKFRGALINLPLTKSIVRDDQDAWFLFRGKIRETGKPEDLELRIQRADAHPRWVKLQARMAEDGGLWITLTDIGDQKQREALIEAKLRLNKYAVSHSLPELLAAAIDEAVALTGSLMGFLAFADADGRFAFQVWSTNTPQHSTGVKDSVSHRPNNEAGVWADCVRLGKAVIHSDFASLPGRKDLPPGHPELIRELVVPVLRENETVALLGLGNKRTDYDEQDIRLADALMDMAWDITLAKRSEESLRLSEARFADLARLSRTATWEVDATGLFTFVGSEAPAVYGYRPEELVGKTHFYDLHPEAGREAFKEGALAIFEKRGSFINFENVVEAKDGTVRWVATSGLPLLAKDGKLLGYRGSDTDVSENRKLTERLVRAQKMETVGELAGGLAHDFNNMLSIINGFCTLLQMDEGQNEQSMDHIERILATTERAADLTASILAFSRKQSMNLRNQDLNPIVASVEVLARRIVRESVTLEIHLAGGKLISRVDSGQIVQLLINLVTNARDAMPGGGRLVISTTSRHLDSDRISEQGSGKAGPYAVIAVSDTGTGMDEETRRRIFEPFFTTKEVGKGTGLGLPIAYGIAAQHGGFIDVTSEAGAGSSFEIHLPLVDAQADEAPANGPVRPENHQGSETILVAEDETELRDFLRQLLSRHGYKVILAVDGVDAVDKFVQHADSVRLLMLDIAMPRMTGKQAYQEILRLRPGTKALFSSGYGRKGGGDVEELGASAQFIPKPYKPIELLRRIREMLDS